MLTVCHAKQMVLLLSAAMVKLPTPPVKKAQVRRAQMPAFAFIDVQNHMRCLLCG